MQTYIFFNRA